MKKQIALLALVLSSVSGAYVPDCPKTWSQMKDYRLVFPSNERHFLLKSEWVDEHNNTWRVTGLIESFTRGPSHYPNDMRHLYRGVDQILQNLLFSSKEEGESRVVCHYTSPTAKAEFEAWSDVVEEERAQ